MITRTEISELVFAREIKLDVILAHILLFLFPITFQWSVYLLRVDIQNHLASYQQNNYVMESINHGDRTLEEILNAPVPTMNELEVMFQAYGNYYGVNPKQLRHLALCESRFRPWVTNGIHAGMYQYNPRTWSATRERMRQDPNPDLRFDAEESVKTTAYKIANEGSGAWVVCTEKFFGRS